VRVGYGSSDVHRSRRFARCVNGFLRGSCGNVQRLLPSLPEGPGGVGKQLF